MFALHKWTNFPPLINAMQLRFGCTDKRKNNAKTALGKRVLLFPRDRVSY